MTTPSAVGAAVRRRRGLVEELLARLARCGAAAPGFTRASYGPDETAAHAVMAAIAADLGLEVRRDAAANTYATLPGRGLPPVLVGSHLDSVAHGGNFDGAAGVVAGLAAVAALRDLDVAPAAT